MRTPSGDLPPLMTGRFVSLKRVDTADAAWMEENLGGRNIATTLSRSTLRPEAELAAALREDSFVDFMLAKQGTSEPVGFIQAYNYSPTGRHASIRMALPSERQRTAWPMEGAALFIDYLFSCFPLNKLYFFMLDSTAHAFGVGGNWMDLEGVLREREFRHGRLQDVYIYAMYRPFWERVVRPWLEQSPETPRFRRTGPALPTNAGHRDDADR